MKKFKFTAIAVALVFGLSSCANNKSREQVSSDSNSNECNAAVAGVAGAIVGGLLAGFKNLIGPSCINSFIVASLDPSSIATTIFLFSCSGSNIGSTTTFAPS